MKVLIAVDGSDCSVAAVQSVAARPWSRDTEFLVLSVAEMPYVEYGLYPPPEGVLEAIHKHLEKIVGNDVSVLKDKFPGNAVEGRVVDGNVRYAVAESAAEWGADLIVMGSHGRRGFNKLLLGSIAESVLHLATCSVEIVKAGPVRQDSCKSKAGSVSCRSDAGSHA